MNELERKVLLAHYIDKLAPSEIARRYTADVDKVREIIVRSWAEDKRCKRFERPLFVVVLGIRFDRDELRWEYSDEVI